MTQALHSIDRATFAIRAVVIQTFDGESESWSRADVRTLSRLFREGLSYGAMAKKMGRTRNAVMCKCKRMRWARVETLKVIRRREQPRPSRAPRQVVPVTIEAGGVTLLDRHPNGCRFAIRQDDRGQWLFCENLRADGSPNYCRRHHHRCHGRWPS